MISPLSQKIDPTLIKLTKIILDEDYKRKVDEIATSVKEHGKLFHAPAVKDNMEIIYGTKRVIAAMISGLDEIEVTVYPSNCAPEFYKGLALHENLKRFNMPWYDQVVAEKELHDLRQIQHGAARPGPGNSGWSLRDTARELDIAIGVLSEDIRMADAVMADPSLKKIEDKTTARRVILTKIKQVSQEVGAAQSALWDIEQYNQVLQGSSEVVLTAFKDATFDVCITDPPWLEFKDSKLVKDEFTFDVFKQIYRVLKGNAFLYAFVSTQDWIIYSRQLAEIGFNVQKWPLVWYKEGVLSRGNTSWQYQRDYEPILLAVKGAPALTGTMLSSVMSCKVVPPASMIHPNQKPPEIIKRLLDHCSYEGSIVLDPFGGSGEVAVQAKQMKRRYVTIERDPVFFEKIKERLK